VRQGKGIRGRRHQEQGIAAGDITEDNPENDTDSSNTDIPVAEWTDIKHTLWTSKVITK